MLLSLFLILIGLTILVAGAESLVRGSSSIASRFSIPPLIIGLTIVSFGTSAPELIVTVLASLQGSSDLALTNVIGSNIANILLVLGVCAIIAPLSVKSATVNREIPLVLIGSVLLLTLAVTFSGSPGVITRFDGILLLAVMAGFITYIIHSVRNGKAQLELVDGLDSSVFNYSTRRAILLTVIGLIGLALGGKILVSGAIDVAEVLGVSEGLIGLTIVAIGTSLPELAASVIAVIRKQTDIAIGNAVGSNIFNIFFVTGAASVIAPLAATARILTDIIVSILAVILLYTFMFTIGRRRLVRSEGVVFILLFIGYISYAIIRG